jgi:hypothetical protein
VCAPVVLASLRAPGALLPVLALSGSAQARVPGAKDDGDQVSFAFDRSLGEHRCLGRALRSTLGGVVVICGNACSRTRRGAELRGEAHLARHAPAWCALEDAPRVSRKLRQAGAAL